jgi:membrane protein
MAAALSFRTIFGLIPTIVVGLAVLGAFSSPQDRSAKIHDLIKLAGFDRIEVRDVPRVPDEGDFFDSAKDPNDTPPREGAIADPPTQRGEGVAKWVEDLIRRVDKINFGAISVIGFATLIYAALAMVVEIEKAFNQIYLAPNGRSWARRIPRYWTLITLGGVGLFVTFAAQGYIMGSIDKIGFVNEHGLREFTSKSLGYAFTVGISTLMFFIIYTTVPNTRVRAGPAIIGAITAAVAWEAGKWGFGEYIRMSLSYARLYGSLALLPLFLMWVYVTWFIVLLGLQFAQAIQAYGTAKAEGLTLSVLGTLGLLSDEEERRRSRQPVVDPASILVVAVEIARRFADGKPSDHSTLHEATGVDERVIADMLERLAGAGILHRLSSGEQEGTYALSKPPETISAIEVLKIGESLSGVDRDHTLPLLRELNDARNARIQGRTLAELLPAQTVGNDSTPLITPTPA